LREHDDENKEQRQEVPISMGLRMAKEADGL
jgi:hypothetical protein